MVPIDTIWIMKFIRIFRSESFFDWWKIKYKDKKLQTFRKQYYEVNYRESFTPINKSIMQKIHFITDVFRSSIYENL
jgi:hypothetical protein